VPTNDPVVRRSAVVSLDHFGAKAAWLRELRDEMGRTGPFDLAVAPPFRPKAPSREDAERFLAEVAELAQHGVNWIWTSLPASSLEGWREMVAWFGEEVIGAWNGR
jgi:hypothetical protein